MRRRLVAKGLGAAGLSVAAHTTWLLNNDAFDARQRARNLCAANGGTCATADPVITSKAAAIQSAFRATDVVIVSGQGAELACRDAVLGWKTTSIKVVVEDHEPLADTIERLRSWPSPQWPGTMLARYILGLRDPEPLEFLQKRLGVCDESVVCLPQHQLEDEVTRQWCTDVAASGRCRICVIADEKLYAAEFCASLFQQPQLGLRLKHVRLSLPSGADACARVTCFVPQMADSDSVRAADEATWVVNAAGTCVSDLMAIASSAAAAAAAGHLLPIAKEAGDGTLSGACAASDDAASDDAASVCRADTVASSRNGRGANEALRYAVEQCIRHKDASLVACFQLADSTMDGEPYDPDEDERYSSETTTITLPVAQAASQSRSASARPVDVWAWKWLSELVKDGSAVGTEMRPPMHAHRSPLHQVLELASGTRAESMDQGLADLDRLIAHGLVHLDFVPVDAAASSTLPRVTEAPSSTAAVSEAPLQGVSAEPPSSATAASPAATAASPAATASPATTAASPATTAASDPTEEESVEEAISHDEPEEEDAWETFLVVSPLTVEAFKRLANQRGVHGQMQSRVEDIYLQEDLAFLREDAQELDHECRHYQAWEAAWADTMLAIFESEPAAEATGASATADIPRVQTRQEQQEGKAAALVLRREEKRRSLGLRCRALLRRADILGVDLELLAKAHLCHELIAEGWPEMKLPLASEAAHVTGDAQVADSASG